MVAEGIGIVLEDPTEIAAQHVVAMAELRTAAPAPELTPQQKDQYLGLAAKLSACIQEGTANDSDLQKWHHAITGAVDADARLLRYDNLQRPYWEEHLPKFNRALDKLTIGLLLDQFSSFGSMHHVLQAVKFGMVADAEFEVQRQMYETILPRHGRVERFAKQGILSRISGALFGSTYQLEEQGDTLVIENGDLDALDTILNDAADMGYRKVELHGPEDYRSAERLAQQIKEMFSGVQPEVGRTQHKIVKGTLWNHQVVYTPITISLDTVAAEGPQPALSQTYRTFGRMAEFPVSDAAAASLRFHPGNFHSFGLAFEAELAAQLQQLWGTTITAEQYADRKSSCYTLFERSAVPPYSKWILLTSQPEWRYALAFLHPGDASAEEVLPTVNEILASSASAEQKVLAMDKRFKPAFVRLKAYGSGSVDEQILVS